MPEKKNVASSQETLLKVEHLCQYFKENKAVDDVSFEVKKGRSIRPCRRVRLWKDYDRTFHHQALQHHFRKCIL